MGRIAAVVAVALVIPACADGARPRSDPGPSREAQVYAEVVRQLVTVDHTFGGGDPRFGTIFIVDRASPRVGEGVMPTEGQGAPIDEETQRAIREALTELPPIRFVPRQEDVVGPVEDGGVVEDNGAVVTLGTIPDDGDRLEVGAGMYIANLAGTWLTYVVERTAEGWEVTGTTGPIAVS
jgi:hypothetical protein